MTHDITRKEASRSLQYLSNTMSLVTGDKIIIIFTVILVGWLVSLVHTTLRPGLRNIPGPWVAKFTQAWRIGLVWKGNAHEEYKLLHEKYGPIVRTAPNVVDISDPTSIATIYGISSKFLKVCKTRRTAGMWKKN